MKGIEPNALNFWAMAKVYAKWGELSTAFSVIDEAARLGHRIPEDAINQLLIACASDREAGFKHAIEVCHLNLSLYSDQGCSVAN